MEQKRTFFYSPNIKLGEQNTVFAPKINFGRNVLPEIKDNDERGSVSTT